jgi:hypothetical protein
MSVVFFCLYAITGTACAALGMLFMEIGRRKLHAFMSFANMALGGLINIVALGYAPQSLISSLDGFVVFFSALFDSSIRDVHAWIAVCCIVVGCVLVVASSTRHIASDAYNWLVDATVMLGTAMGVFIVTTFKTVSPVAPGLMGGCTQTMAKAFDIAVRVKGSKLRRSYGFTMLVFSATQAYLLWLAMKSRRAVQVNSVYTVVLNLAGTAMGILVYKELEISTFPTFLLGYVSMCLGSYFLYVRE